MGGRPFGPWTAVAAPEDLPEGAEAPRPPRRGALAGTVFDRFAQLYETCLTVSPALTPPVVDEMELWEVAVVLGKARPEDLDGAEPAAAEAAVSPEEHQRALERHVALRRYENIRRRRAGLPELAEEPDRPQHLDPALATLIPTNAPDRLS